MILTGKIDINTSIQNFLKAESCLLLILLTIKVFLILFRHINVRVFKQMVFVLHRKY